MSISKSSPQKTPVLIPLYNFKYRHAPLSRHESDTDAFFGREQLLREFIDLIESNRSVCGSYLITGYRGSGKTSFVNHAISILKRRENKSYKQYIDVHLNLGNDSSLLLDNIYFDLVSGIRNALTNIILNILKEQSDDVFEKLKKYITDNLFISNRKENEDNFSEICTQFSKSSNVDTEHYHLCPESKIQILRLIHKLTDLEEMIFSSIEERRKTSFGLKYIADLTYKKRKTINTPSYNNSQIELSLIDIINDINSIEIDNKGYTPFTIIIIFDELDKIGTSSDNDDHLGISEEIYNRKREIDLLLEKLKGFISTASAMFVFIAGRDMYDSYLAEQESTAALYESIFNKIIYIPSLLTDISDNQPNRLASMIESFVVKLLCNADENSREKDYIKLGTFYDQLKAILNKLDESEKEKVCTEIHAHIHILRNFIHYLTFSSWGNIKKLITLIERYTIPYSDDLEPHLPKYIKKNIDKKYFPKYFLSFTRRDIQIIFSASSHYILLHQRLSRRLSVADDKLVVSTFIAYHYILKFHGKGFNREYLERMSEALNIHRSPELNRITDTVIQSVMKPMLRQTILSHYKYRFISLYQQEVRYISEVSGYESARFNFSLDSHNKVKNYYLNLLQSHKCDFSDQQESSIPRIYLILGQIALLEQDYDSANAYLRMANISLRNTTADIQHSTEQLLLLEITITQGELEERRVNYDQALSLYRDASIIFDSIQSKRHDGTITNPTRIEDPKWAIAFILLKHEPLRLIDHEWHYENYLLTNNPIIEDRFKYARLMFYANQYESSCKQYLELISLSGVAKGKREFPSYLAGLSLVRLGISLAVNYCKHVHRRTTVNLESYKAKGQSYNNRVIDGYLKVITDSLMTLQCGQNGDILDSAIAKVVITNKRIVPSKFKENDIFWNLNDKLITRMYRNPKKYEFIYSIGLIAHGASILQRTSLQIEAAQAYISIVFIIGMFFELFPFRRYQNVIDIIDKYNNHKSQTDSILAREKLSDSIQELVSSAAIKAKDCLSLAHEQSFSHFIKTFWDVDLQHDEKPDNTISHAILSDPFEHIFGFKNNEFPSDNVIEKHASESCFWQHSIIGKFLLQMLIWENKSRTKVLGVKKSIPDLDLEYIPPYPLRSYIIALWQTAKNQIRQIHLFKASYNKSNNKSEPKEKTIKCCLDYLIPDNPCNKFNSECENCILKATRIAVDNLYMAWRYTKQASGNEHDLMFPPLFLIFYNLWEVLYELLHFLITVIYDEKTKNKSLHDVSHKMRSQLLNVYHLKNKNNNEMSTNFMDYFFAKQKAIEQLKISEDIGDLGSRTRLHILKSKFHLDNDYADHFFYIDWSCYQMFSGAAVIHKLQIERDHDDLLSILIKEKT